jgi:hypothetical protein
LATRQLARLTCAGVAVLPICSTGWHRAGRKELTAMRGYVAKRRDRFYAVIYEGIDPITGRERRRWHPAGTDRTEAELLAARLAADHRGNDCGRRSGPTLGVYLTRTWLPSKQVTLRSSTWDTYRRNIELHVLPELGRVPIRHLRAQQLKDFLDLAADHRLFATFWLAANTGMRRG